MKELNTIVYRNKNKLKPFYLEREFIKRKKDRHFLSVFINYFMRNGKKAKSYNIVVRIIPAIKEKTKYNFYFFFNDIILIAQPFFSTKNKARSGSSFPVPYLLSAKDNKFKVLKWLKNICKNKRHLSIRKMLETELLNAFNKGGSLLKKKDEFNSQLKIVRAFIK